MLRKSDNPPPLGEFETLILTSIIAAGQDAYGVTIHEQVENLAGPAREISLGSVYTTLERLEHKGYITSSKGEATPERGGRAKRYYKVEACGKRALDAALTSMKRAWDVLAEAN